MSLPLPLTKADLTQPFLYDRKWGVFYVAPGFHQAAMACLLAFQMDLNSGIEAARAVGGRSLDEAADYYLKHTPGVSYRSSAAKKPQWSTDSKGTPFCATVGKKILAGRRGALNAIELRVFGKVEYLFSDLFTEDDHGILRQESSRNL